MCNERGSRKRGGGGGGGFTPKKKRVSLADQAMSMKLSDLKKEPMKRLRGMQSGLENARRWTQVRGGFKDNKPKIDKAKRNVEAAIRSKV